MCSYFRSRGGFDWLRRQRVAQPLSILTAFTALVMATYCNRIWPGWLPPSIIGSCLLVLGVYASSPLSRFFAMRFSCWLGRISFPLYLTHFPVIASFTSCLVVQAHAHNALPPTTIWLIVFGSASLSLFSAVLFLPVEMLTVRISDIICHSIMQRGPGVAKTLLRHLSVVTNSAEGRCEGLTLTGSARRRLRFTQANVRSTIQRTLAP